MKLFLGESPDSSKFHKKFIKVAGSYNHSQTKPSM